MQNAKKMNPERKPEGGIRVDESGKTEETVRAERGSQKSLRDSGG